MNVHILIMAHGLMYIDKHNNTMQFRSPKTTVITVAPMARTSWSNLQVEYALLMALHKNRQTNPDTPFDETVKKSSEESGVLDVIKKYPTHIPKAFGIQHNDIANKLLIFDDDSDSEKDPYYGIWYLDDAEGPINLFDTVIEFPKVGEEDKKMYYFSEIVETLQSVFPDPVINILDYSCSSCVYPNSEIVRNADSRTVRRLSRRMQFILDKKKQKRNPQKKTDDGSSRKRSRSSSKNSSSSSRDKSRKAPRS